MTTTDPALINPLENAPLVKLLIADDCDEFRDGLIKILRRHQFECTGASSSNGAIDRLQTEEFDALISDVQMPGNAGLELIASVSKLTPGLPVILLTGQPSVDTAIRAVGLPVTAYLTKPPQIAELVNLLQVAVADYRCLRCVDESRERLRHWDAKLKSIAQSLRNPKPAAARPFACDYLHNGLQHVLHELASLEQSVAIWTRDNRHQVDQRSLNLIGTIQHAVDVLKQTKQDFKSVKLAELRRHLEDVIAS